MKPDYNYIKSLERDIRSLRAQVEHRSDCVCGCQSGSPGLHSARTLDLEIQCFCCPESESYQPKVADVLRSVMGNFS